MLLPTFKYEMDLWKLNHKVVVGIDEVGRGAFAGPLVIAAVAFRPFSIPIPEINDSKKLSFQKRENLSPKILKNALLYNIIEISVNHINKYGMAQSLRSGYKELINLFPVSPNHILIDGYKTTVFPKSKQTGIIKGDSQSVSIAAASIIAKVYRDQIMSQLQSKLVCYNFAQNKGYGTREHREAIKKYGISQMHRIEYCKNYN